MAGNSVGEEKVAGKIVEIISDITYVPTYEQRKVKTQFHNRLTDNPICEAHNATLAIVQQLVPGDRRITRWWADGGFRDWFLNRDEFRERAESLVHLALDTIEQILGDNKAQASARVSAAKLMMEVGRKMPSKSDNDTQKMLDAHISNMNEKELQEYIQKTTPRLVSQPQPNISTPQKENEE